DEIRREAKTKHIPWDFYDALQRHLQVSSSRNWKLHDSLRRTMTAEIARFGEPVIRFYDARQWGGQEITKIYEEEKTALAKHRNPEFYSRDWGITRYSYQKVLIKEFRSDLEYAAWSLFSSGQLDSAKLSEVIGDRYPLSQLIEFERISSWRNEDVRQLLGEEVEPAANPRVARLQAFSDRYADRAVSLLAREAVLQERFSELNRENASSEEYKALREDCRQFEKDRKTFSAKEKELSESCTIVENLIRNLDDKYLGFEIQDGILKIATRNLQEAKATVKSGKNTIFTTRLENSVRSYYRIDTLTVELPQTDDGTYSVTCSSGTLSVDSDWEKYTISIATKYDSKGFSIFAADYRSGRPIPGYERGFIPWKGSRDSCSVSFKDNGIVRRSKPLRLGEYNIGPYPDRPATECILLTDCSAFKPGETVRYKAILYTRGYSLNAAPAGRKLTAILRDTQGNEISRQTLTTGEFGSADGSFVLERRDRGGLYTIVIESEGKRLASKNVRVDDFVLPTFAIVYDRDQMTYKAGETVRKTGSIRAYSGHSLAGAQISYRVERWGELIAEGPLELDATGRFSISFPTEKKNGTQYYTVNIKVTDATGETAESGLSVWVDGELHPVNEKPVEYTFTDISDDAGIGLRVIGGRQEIWALVELYGLDGRLLESRLAHIPAGEASFRYGWRAEYPDAISLSVLYFQNGSRYTRSVVRRRPDTRYDLPLTFTRFLDTTAPGASYTFEVKTLPGVECVATIFDKSTEAIQANAWTTVRANQYPSFSPSYRCANGTNSSYGHFRPLFVRGAGVMYKSANAAVSLMADSAGAVADEGAVQEEAIAFCKIDGLDASSPAIREDFATTVAWEPCLQSDKDGRVSFSFRNSDKLSTFVVQLFAYDRAMKNSTIRRDITVTLPVKIALMEPQYLYTNDIYTVRVSLSNSTSAPVRGTLRLITTGAGQAALAVDDSLDPGSGPSGAAGGQHTEMRIVTVPAGGQTMVEIPVGAALFGIAEAPGDRTGSGPSDQAADLTVTATFTPDDPEAGGDGVRVRIPVRLPVQTITEAHSAVWLSGADREALERSLRAEFVNIPGSAAVLREITILDMIREAIPQTFEAEYDNAISLMKTIYAALLASTLPGGPQDAIPDVAGLCERLEACRTAEGGYGWMKGMDASPMVTAQVLDLASGLRQRGITLPASLEESLGAAVKYIDKEFFRMDSKRPWWCGRLSMEQYLYIRSLYADIPLDTKPVAKTAKNGDGLSRKAAAKLRGEIRNYLTPGRTRGLNGNIFAKTRRMLTLIKLNETAEGQKLAKQLGVKLFTRSRLQKSLKADTASIVQYAVKHPHGGMYYPNAVMPWRGLLENELCAHAMLCELLDSQGYKDISEGIRLWLILQKETQEWRCSPASVNAIAAVLDGTPETLDTRVLALSGSFTKPFADIRPAGNGFTVAVSYYRIVPASVAAGGGGNSVKSVNRPHFPQQEVYEPIQEGDTLRVGDSIIAQYEIYNEENRSFVRLTAPRPACLRPQNQLSGYTGGGFRPMPGAYSGGAYRSVLDHRSEYWYESYPEEKTTVEERLYVTQEGIFHCAVPQIECLYAPHYRANGEAGIFTIFGTQN
ncbi:MAG: hypothetical protein IJS07_08125, partial [Bacteroidales bacterium]|nr:hypothetical protein [Bacteroidales bacterium]